MLLPDPKILKRRSIAALQISKSENPPIPAGPTPPDGLRAATNTSDDNCSHDKTLVLVDSFLAHKNVKRILLNDEDIIEARTPRVQHWPGHDNHLHIIMKQ